MCNCIEQISEATKDYLFKKLEAQQKKFKVNSSGFLSQDLFSSRLALEFELKYDEDKKVKVVTRKITTYVFLTYCPFCGKKYPPKK